MKIYRVIFKSIYIDECDNTVTVTTFIDEGLARSYFERQKLNLKSQEKELDMDDYAVDENEDSYERYLDHGVRIDIWTHFMRGCIMKLCTPI